MVASLRDAKLWLVAMPCYRSLRLSDTRNVPHIPYRVYDIISDNVHFSSVGESFAQYKWPSVAKLSVG